ncbi:MAG: hypothetical protein PWR27_1581, partial [Petroclostridium sp.]|nr:hypothetical protein [Petroclostridium sp.]
NNIYSLILVVIFKIKSVPNRDKVKGKRYKVAFSIVLFQCYFNQHIVFNSFKINTFSLITYPLTLSYRKQTPQQIKISPASTTGFWNELYFYRANFIIMESSLFVLYNNHQTFLQFYSTVTDFARFLGLSTSHPFATAT